MTDYYYDSAATGANDGTSKTDAWTTFAAAEAAMSAGDRLFASHTSAETHSGSDYEPGAGAGTVGSPIQVYSIDFSDDSYTPGASISVTSDNAFYLMGQGAATDNGHWEIHGMTFAAGDRIRLTATTRLFDCTLDCDTAAGGTSSALMCGSGSPNASGTVLELIDCTINMNHASNRIYINSGQVTILGGSLTGTATSKVFDFASNNQRLDCVGFDASNAQTSATITGAASSFTTSLESPAIGVFSGCLFPASYSLGPTILSPGALLINYGSSDASRIYEIEISSSAGVVLDNTSTYRNSAATYDGTNEFSLELTPTTAATTAFPLKVKVFERYLTANPTLTFQLAYDSLTNLQDDEVWLEVHRPNATNASLREIQRTRPELLAAGTDLNGTGTATGTASTWTESFSNANLDEISHTVTGGADGVHIVYLCYAPGATTPVLYADMCPDIS